jgi:Mg-chelatase subunit ChlD
MTERKSTADIIVVLDESGSMSSMGPEPVQAMNAFITEQQQNAGDSKLSLYTFNTVVRQIYNEVNLADVKGYNDYSPDGMTALYDCIGKAISNKVATRNHNNTVLVIITDGLDNSSKEFTAESIKKRIKHMEDVHNWQVIFLAANQDAFAAGGNLNVKGGKCANYTMAMGQLNNIVRQTSAAVSAYRNLSQECSRPAEINLGRATTQP